MFCTKCGKEISDKAAFCPFCGARKDQEPVGEETASEPRPTPGYAPPGPIPGYSQPPPMPGYAQPGPIPEYMRPAPAPGYPPPVPPMPGYAPGYAIPGYARQAGTSNIAGVLCAVGLFVFAAADGFRSLGMYLNLRIDATSSNLTSILLLLSAGLAAVGLFLAAAKQRGAPRAFDIAAGIAAGVFALYQLLSFSVFRGMSMSGWNPNTLSFVMIDLPRLIRVLWAVCLLVSGLLLMSRAKPSGRVLYIAASVCLAFYAVQMILYFVRVRSSLLVYIGTAAIAAGLACYAAARLLKSRDAAAGH